ncbi:von Willebrand factor A domain-containing protein 3A [Pristis pectinata]|uniref:von Willebrand factor A domain-containing protein 3A n=1 Tax=Pristis pectinata TaxID=685728 RepID=UPI00223D08CC|nr:von Willebrand factor A domain-containing protein 3A [Pristis pectinata]
MKQHTGNMADILANEQFLRSELSRSRKGPQQQREVWQELDPPDLPPDDGLLVTHVNQTSQLLKTGAGAATPTDAQTSAEWLANHGLERQKLTVHDLLAQGRIVTSKTEAEVKHLQVSLDLVDSFESRVRELINMCQKRIQWLKEESRKVFGLVKGRRLGVLVDCSNANCGLGRQRELQEALLALLDEQLGYMRQLYLLGFGSDLHPLWETARDVNVRTLDEARQWVQGLHPSGSCNLLRAVNRVVKVRRLDGLLVILGTCPDQPAEILCDHVQQCLLGRRLPIHAVAYDCSDHMTQALLRSLAETSGGRYHSYTLGSQTCWGSDMEALVRELERAGEVLERVSELRSGLVGDALGAFLKEVSTEVAGMPPAGFLPCPPNHEGPLSVETPSFLPRTSAEWLKENGLKARKLGLYQVLAPNAFSPLEEFVPILRKTVSSTLHQKAMMQLEWYDGTVKNLHVDPPQLFEYQKRLSRAMTRFEHRTEWLSSRSRRMWGNLCEKRVIVVLDTSLHNVRHIIHLQHSVRLLLEQQLANKETFNLLAFGSEVRQYQPGLVPVTPANLQAAWRWCLALQCGGSRNLLAALKAAMENDQTELGAPCGLYLLTTGVPDQAMVTITSYVAELCAGRDLRLHACLFSIDPELEGPPPPRYASPRETADAVRELARSGHGRFHWFRETGIVESDDIQLLLAEMEKAANYSEKCALLLQSLRQRWGKPSPEQPVPADSLQVAVKKGDRCPPKLLAPKPTALTLARMRARGVGAEESRPAARALTWRPSSGKEAGSGAHPGTRWACPPLANQPRRKVSRSAFYTDEGNKVGAVYQTYPRTRSVRTVIPSISLPKEEEICSTAEWLQKLSVRKLGLDLHRLVSGPGCSHRMKLVPSLHRRVCARFCSEFPKVQINGEYRHLYLQPQELDCYIERVEQLLRRYLGRLQWLLSGSRRLFGTILEKRVCILLDTSGSTEPFLAVLKKELSSLIWEQLRRNSHSFNLLTFAEQVDSWRDGLVEATDATCHDAIQWVSNAIAHGNTCTLEALQSAFRHLDVQGVYLLTDGKPDTSCRLVLKEMQQMNRGRGVKVHTISFNCTDSTANEFLKKLAAQTGGRFHRCHGALDGQLVAHKMITEGFSDEDHPNLPAFEGDDLKRLSEEITKARQFLTQARSFRTLLSDKQTQGAKATEG